MTRRLVRRAERGAALLIMLAIIGLGASWFVVSKLNSETGGIEAVRKKRNAEVMNRAKQALIGYVAAQAAKQFEDDPGRMPCPEASGSFGNATTEGIAPGTCTLPAVGRLPWRTLGIEKLVDASGEPLWYVLAAGWAKPNSTTNTLINSNCSSAASGLACATSQLNVDGTANAAVALIIAPGPAFSAAAATGCTAHSQVRPEAGPLEFRNYLECTNATSPADMSFVTTGPSGSFNDQVLTVTAAEVLPGIEAAVADRANREIVPALKSVYTAPNWGLAGTDRVYPFAAPFNDPLTLTNPDTPDTASYNGMAGTTQGLLPFAHSHVFPHTSGPLTACTAGAGAPRCNPNLVSWSDAAPSATSSGVGVTLTQACSYFGPTSYGTCNGIYTGLPTTITVTGRQSNGAMSLRKANPFVDAPFVFTMDLTTFAFVNSSPAHTVVLNSDGTFSVSVTMTPPAPANLLVGVMYWVFIPGNATTDHDLLDGRASSSANPPPQATSWFARNEWHKLAYYAVASSHTAAGAAPRTCTTGVSCLSITNVSPAGGQHAALFLAGRSLNGSARPSATLGDYLDFGNATGAFERQAVNTRSTGTKKPFNDRVVVMGSN
jgi:hypothetical protein